MVPTGFFVLGALAVLVALASAVVARAAARDARADLRNLVLAMERIGAEQEGLLVRLRRIEGRQTARLGRDGPPGQADGFPDPNRDPEGWRAAVRRMAIQPKPRGDLQ